MNLEIFLQKTCTKTICNQEKTLATSRIRNIHIQMALQSYIKKMYVTLLKYGESEIIKTNIHAIHVGTISRQ
jgi:hypothetical protein